MDKLTLLFAEDDLETRENYTFVLKKYFHLIYSIENGEKALSTYYEKKPDILLLDFDMPFLNGLEVAEIVRKQDTQIPIIIFSAYTEEHLSKYLSNLKIDAFLLKPVSNDLLFRTISDMIEYVQDKK